MDPGAIFRQGRPEQGEVIGAAGLRLRLKPAGVVREVFMRTVAVATLVTLLATGAVAQIPAGPGQQPGTLAPAPPVIAPPPPVAPRPVPSVVTPLPSPSYGVPSGVTRAPSYGSRGTATYVYPPPKKKKRTKPRLYRGSMLPLHLV
jgi:hypothetical protein